jgi:hypothetical protein
VGLNLQAADTVIFFDTGRSLGLGHAYLSGVKPGIKSSISIIIIIIIIIIVVVVVTGSPEWKPHLSAQQQFQVPMHLTCVAEDGAMEMEPTHPSEPLLKHMPKQWGGKPRNHEQRPTAQQIQ